MVAKNIYDRSSEHAFAQYIRLIGKGKTGGRSLTQAEAEQAWSLLMRGEVEDVQVGAFLMLLRVKEESPEELAGFVAASRATLQAPALAVDVDWSSYAGKRKHLPWFLLAALLLAENGARVFMHGASGHTANRLYTEAMLPELGHPPCQNWQEVGERLDSHRFAFMPLAVLSPPLQRLIGLRNLFGLRSPVHTLSRLLNPLDARCTLQAIFHPAYRDSHQQAAALLGYPNSLVIKGEGGEFERNPDGRCQAQGIRNGTLYGEEWPMLFDERHAPEEQLDPAVLLAVWRGKHNHEYGEMAVIATVALALTALQWADSQEAALATARAWWEKRRAAQQPKRGEQLDLFA